MKKKEWRNSDPSSEPTLDLVSFEGIQIGNYRLEERIGSGSFGTVYRGWDVKLERNVAVKFLKENVDDTTRKLFEREARTIAGLGRHSGIVQIFGWGEYLDHLYFVLEYLDSSTDDLLRNYPQGMPVNQALKIVEKASDALQYAHDQEVIHRDIKPANILLDLENDNIKLADFGLAFRGSKGADSILGTVSGGTPPYMSPQQILGEKVDYRTDIFALGVTLYKFLSGKTPAGTTDTTEMVKAVLEDRLVPLEECNPDLSEPVYKLVRKAMAYRPQDRFESASAFAKGIRGCYTQADAFSPTIPAFSKRKKGLSNKILETIKRYKKLSAAAALAVMFLAVSFTGLVNIERYPGQGYLLQQADAMMDDGKFLDAIALYDSLAEDNPNGDYVNAGLGYAHLLQEDFAAAREYFERIGDAGLQREGLAAVQRELRENGLQDHLQDPATAYQQVILAAEKHASGQPREALDVLQAVSDDELRFNWQRLERLRLLAQCQYRLGNYADAKALFRQLEGASAGGSSFEQAAARAYLTAIDRRETARQQDANLERARELACWLETGEIERFSDEDLWTSRPLRYLVLPPATGASVFALETGLEDYLPYLLERHLDDSPRLAVVDRSVLDTALAEQELSSYLASDAGQVGIGQLLGARLLVRLQFFSFMQEDEVGGALVDTETTRRFTLATNPLSRRMDPHGVAAALAGAIQERIDSEYPLRGAVRNEDGEYVIDIGASLGVERGAEFYALSERDVYAPVVMDTPFTVINVRSDDAVVEPAEPETVEIPEGGWPVIEREWYEQQVLAR